MDNSEEIFAEIRKICLTITESAYQNGIRQCREMLVRLHDMGCEQSDVYRSLLQASRHAAISGTNNWCKFVHRFRKAES